MDFYYPGHKFPSFSVTGSHCPLNCPHCKGKYLEGMIPVETPRKLYEEAMNLSDRGGNGLLLSGGTDPDGKIPLSGYFPVIKEIKRKTDLIINIHTGVLSKKYVDDLKESCVDVVSYDMIGDDSTIEKIYGLDLTVYDYKKGYELLMENGIKVVPHITIGLNEGSISGEYNSIDILSSSQKIILNSLIPSDFGSTVDKDDFLSVVEYAGNNTDADLIIGCMREKGRAELEIESIKLGVRGIVLPSKKTIEWAEERYKIDKIKTCCAVQ